MDLASILVAASAEGWVKFMNFSKKYTTIKELPNLRDIVKVRKVLASDPYLVNCESDGRTPLLAAVHHQRTEV